MVTRKSRALLILTLTRTVVREAVRNLLAAEAHEGASQIHLNSIGCVALRWR